MFFHVSEEPGIAQFDPRPSSIAGEAVVWAIDECAGYSISRVAVRPVFVDVINDAVTELLNRGVEFRTMPNLWRSGMRLSRPPGNFRLSECVMLPRGPSR